MRTLKELKLEITNRCALQCIHCSTGTDNDKGTFLFPEHIRTILHEAKAMGCNDVSLSGGEPLLHPEIAQIINDCIINNFKVKLHTSGIILPGPTFAYIKTLRDLKKKGLDTMIFSIYSAKSTVHDYMTNKKGSYNITIKTIQNAIKAGINVELHFIVTKMNIRHLPGIVELMQQLHVPKIHLLRFVPQGRGFASINELLPSTNEYRQLKETIMDLRSGGIDIKTESAFNFLLFGHPTKCTTGCSKIVIDASGNAHPCDALKRVQLFHRSNDISKYTLTDIFNNDPLFRLVQTPSFPNECLDCLKFNICRSGCTAQRLLFSADYCTPDPNCLLSTKISKLKFME